VTSATKRNRKLASFIQSGSKKATAYAYRLSGNWEEAAELVQEATFRMVCAWDSYDQAKPLETWFLTILRNLFYDSQKRSMRKNLSINCPAGEEGEEYSELLPGPKENPTADLEREETREAVQTILGRLTPRHRRILRCCDMQGMDYEQAGRALGLPKNTVGSQLSRARQAFKRHAASVAATWDGGLL
jgi:RNA polymerase sigma-70 factor (ECF subfamily)